MADWQAFATAFMKDTAGYINERKDKAEEYGEKQRELSEASNLSMQRRSKVATTIGGVAARLIRSGVPEDVVRTAGLSPTGLMDLDAQWTKAQNAYGKDFATANPELVSTMVSTDLSAEQLGMSGENATTLDEFLKSQYNLSKTTAGDYKAPVTGVFSRMMGYGATDRVREKLDTEMAGMGMSVYDINQAAKTADFESTVPGSTVSYGKMPSVFTVEDSAAEVRELRNMATTIKQDPKYIDLLTALKKERVRQAEGGKIFTEKEMSDSNLLINKIQTDLDTMMAAGLKQYIMGKNDFYFNNSYLDTMSGTLANITSSSFVESLYGLEPTEEVVTKADAPVVDAPKADAPVVDAVEEGEVTENPFVLQGTPYRVVVTEEGEQIQLQDDLSVNGKLVARKGQLLSVETSAGLLDLILTKEEFEAQRQATGRIPLTKEQYDDMSDSQLQALGLRTSVIGRSIDQEFGGGLINDNFAKSVAIQESADPDKTYRVYIPQFAGKTRYFAVKGSDLKYFSKARLANNQKAAVVIEGAVQGDERPMSTKRLKNKFGDPDKKPVEKKLSPIDVDEDQNRVLEEHGGTIMRALKDSGITQESSDREFEKALTEWSYDNQVEMPFDRRAIIHALKLFIGPGE